MSNTKTWDAALIVEQNKFGCAASAAYNNPAVYPVNGFGVQIGSYSSDTGDVNDIFETLLNSLIHNAAGAGIVNLNIFTNAPFDKNRYYSGPVRVNLFQSDMSTGGDPDDPAAIRTRMARDDLKHNLEALEENAGKITFDAPPLVPGQYVLYQNGSQFTLGRVKRVTGDGAFVWYSTGDTASKTSIKNLHVLENPNVILNTNLGGDDARTLFPD